MTIKLLKYELIASGKILLPIYAVLAAMCMLLSISGFQWDISSIDAANTSILFFVMMTFFIVIFVASIATFIIVMQRYYICTVGDEAYLINTLPVTSGQIILSRILSSLIWYAGLTVASVIPMVILFRTVLDMMWMYCTEVVGYSPVRFVVVLAVFCFSSILYQLVHYYLSVVIGQAMSDTHKKSAVAATYIIISMLISFVWGIISSIVSMLSFVKYDFTQDSASDMLSVLTDIYGMMFVLMMIFSVAGYFVAAYILKKKLNMSL